MMPFFENTYPNILFSLGLRDVTPEVFDAYLAEGPPAGAGYQGGDGIAVNIESSGVADRGSA